MGVIARMKSIAGGDAIRTLASAATVYVPANANQFYVSGTTAITSLLQAVRIPNRKVTFIGAAGASVLFTNTNTPTTAGQMYLQGVDQTLLEDGVIELFGKNDGTWSLAGSV